MSHESGQTDSVLLHIIVVGFHHKKGCQIEYAYPPLVPGTAEDSGQVPPEWKHIPTLALPDGSHNYSKDTVYFHIKNRGSHARSTIYGVSCYRQIDAQDVLNKAEDVTRGTIQKSVCVLTTLPYYGAIAAKLELVTHAWFDQKDFTKLELLKDAYLSLSTSLSSINIQSQSMIGLHIHDVVKLYRHKMLVLFKLILLERKTVFFMTPVSDLCNVILSVISLFPGLLEQGLVESVENNKTKPISPSFGEEALSGDEDEPFAEVSHTLTNTSNTDRNGSSTHDCHQEPDIKNVKMVDESPGDAMQDTQDAQMKADLNVSFSETSGNEIAKIKPASSNIQVHSYTGDDGLKPIFHDSIPELDSVDAMREIDIEDQESSIWNSQKSSLQLRDSFAASDDGRKESTSSRGNLSLDLKAPGELSIVPVVSPTNIPIDMAGLPLAIFTKGSVCHPYLSLSYYDILEDVNTRSFVIGASNVLFKQKRHNVDVIVEGSSTGITIHDKELVKQLQLTTEDLRFANMVCKGVDETVASGEFLETTEWEGGDEWIRAQFKDYLLSLMATVLAEDNHLLEAFNINFVNAWKTTHNFRVWRSTVQHLHDAIPGHPCQGGVRLNDVKLQLARSERGRRFNAVVDQAGKAVTDTTKAVGGAFRSYVSSWWSNLGSPST